MTRVSAPTAAVHGVLLLDKDSGISSNAALQRAKRLLGGGKAGHTGSLDPLASGLLPICLGEATKLAAFLLETDKRYRVTVHLGQSTDSGDADGHIIKQRPVPAIDHQTIEATLQRFRGTMMQTPPMFAALKHQGRRLYELARRGIEVERPRRRVEIFALHLMGFDGCQLDLDVHCSKGTYIRSLAIDLGIAFGCGAHVSSLRRTAVGPLSIEKAHRLESIQALELAARRALLEPMDLLVASLPVVAISDEACGALRHGQRVHIAHAPREGLVRLEHPAQGLIGIGVAHEAGWIAPQRLFRFQADEPECARPLAATDPLH